MMNKEKLAKDLRRCRNPDHCGLQCPRFSFAEDCIGKLTTDAADAIEELLADVPKWISVEERLPDEWREVLTYSPIHSDEKNPHMIQLCWYIGNGKWRECQYGEIMEIPITHWMPLPKAPEPLKEETE